MPGSRGEANLVEKCKLCNRVNTLSILPDTVGSYSIEKNEKWQSMVVFDCRGIEPFDFDPRVCFFTRTKSKFFRLAGKQSEQRRISFSMTSICRRRYFFSHSFIFSSDVGRL